MKHITILYAVLFLFLFSFSFSSEKKEEIGKFNFGINTKESQDIRIEINETSKEKMLALGISKTYTNKIEEYKNITGGFLDISELKRISGIGEKTYEKLRKNFKIKEKINKKNLKLNTADDKTLKYYGMTKEEIKNIKIFKEKNNKFFSNLDLMEVLSKKRYDIFKDQIDY
ncbi:MAG: ComEA family DNA-binding protein [Fusobacteriaceae bacterium]